MYDTDSYSDESYPYGFEYGEEIQLYHGESYLRSADVDSSFDYADETSDLDFERDERLSDRDGLIDLIEQLRLQQSVLNFRKNAACHALTALLEKGLTEYNVPTRAGTPVELYAFYENLLLKFKEAKESWLKRKQKLNELIKLNAEHLELTRRKCSDFSTDHAELELNTGLAMIHSKTGKKLDRDVIVNIIDVKRKTNKRIGKLFLKHLIETNKCINMKNNIERIKSSFSFSIEEYQQFVRSIMMMEINGEKNNKKISEVRLLIKSTLELSPNIPNRLAELNEIKQYKEFELNRIKNQWKIEVLARSRKQAVSKNSSRQPDYFTGNPRLLKDYEDNVKKVKENEIKEAELCQQLAKNEATINCLKAKVKKIGTM